MLNDTLKRDYVFENYLDDPETDRSDSGLGGRMQ